MKKTVLCGKSLEELETLFLERGQSKFRAKQVYNRLYLKSVSKIDDLTDLATELLSQLKEEFKIVDMEIKDKQISKDSTIKYLFELSDGLPVEAVLMRFDNRANLTACISSQVGCPMGCKFCATANLHFKRNLSAIEIAQQILLIQADTRLKVTNVVFMGQGEPMLNLDNILGAIDILRKHFQIGSRRITVSTCGIIEGINKLASLDFQSTLALSLHAPNDTIRNQIMPVSKKYKLPDLMRALTKYTEKTGRRVTIEYLLIRDINDSPENAKELAILINKLKCNVNLIVYNPHEFSEFKRPKKDTIMKFKYILEASGKKVTVRLERGLDIDAACGQLASKSGK